MLELSRVCAGYGGSDILFDVDLAVPRGAVLALVGRNGAGKSTTFKTIAGQLALHGGSIRWDGAALDGLKPHAVARLGIGFVPEDRQIFSQLSVQDNLALGAKPGPTGTRAWSMADVYRVFPALERLKHRIAGRLSGGEQQMLTIARTLMGNPDVLLLDEPSEGLAPIIVRAIADLIGTISRSGMTILLAEQNVAFCEKVATHAAVIERGRIVFHDTMQSLASNTDIKRRYLAV